jgi:hypothetical protein
MLRRYVAQKVVHEDKYPITGLGFKQLRGSRTVLFIVTTDGIYLCDVTQSKPATVCRVRHAIGR